MHTTLALGLALLAQADFIPLEPGDDDDRPVAATFGPGDAFAFIGHADGGSVTRLDVSTGLVDRRLDLGLSVRAIERTAGGTRGLVLVDDVLHVVSLPALQLLSSTPLSLSGTFRIHPDAAGAVAVVEATDDLSVVDLQLGTEVRTIHLPPFTGSPSTLGRRAHLASDDRTFAYLAEAGFGTVEVRTVDALTGAFGATALVGANASQIQGLLASGDRSTVVAVHFRSAPAATRFEAFDPLAPAAPVVTVLNGVVGGRQGAISRDGTRAYWLRGNQFVSFPLDGATHGVGTPSTQSFGAPELESFTISADETRWHFGTYARGEALVADTAGALLGAVDLDEASGGFGHDTVASRTGARFLALAATRERVALLDAAGATPVVSVRANSGLGDEVDGPFAVAALEDSRTVLVTARQSDRLLRVDVTTGAILGSLASARDPWFVELVDDALALVGHADGTLLAVDPSGPSEVGRVALGGPIVDLEPVPGTTRAWVRVEVGGSTELALVEPVGPTAGVVTSALLRVGPANAPESQRPLERGTLAVDHLRGLAYVYSPQSMGTEIVDLTTTPPTTLVPGPTAVIALNRGGITLTPDGLTAYTLTSPEAGVLEAFDTPPASGSGLVPRWNVAIPPTLFLEPNGPSLAQAEDGSAVVVDLTNAPPSPSFPGSGVVALRASDGALLDRLDLAGVSGFTVEADRLVLSDGTQMHTARFEAGQFHDLETVPAPRTPLGAPSVGRAQGFVAVQAPDIGYLDGQEGLVVLDLFDGRTTIACTGGLPNATGVQAEIGVSGSAFAGDELTLTVGGLQPSSMFGMLVVGSSLVPPMPAGTGLGRFCVGGTIGRLTAQVQVADANGEHRYVLDTGAVPTSVGVIGVQPGEAWTFQGWHRDQAPGGAATSNTSTAVEVRFR